MRSAPTGGRCIVTDLERSPHEQAHLGAGGPGDRRRHVEASVPLRARAGRRPQGPRRHPGRADRQARRRRDVDHRAGGGRRRPGPHRQAPRRNGGPAGRALCARRRLGARQCRDPRSTRARARGRDERRGGVRGVRPLPRGALPGRDRAGLRHGPLDHPRRPHPGHRRVTPRGRRRLGRRQHDRGARDPGQAARRRQPSCTSPSTTRSPTPPRTPTATASSPMARSSPPRAWRGSGTPTCPSGTSGPRSPCRPASEPRPARRVAGGVRDRGRERCAARRGRGLCPQAHGGGRSHHQRALQRHHATTS